MADNALVVEGETSQVFAPVKNAEGAATDTPSATRKAISNLHRTWLEAAGATIDDNAIVEIHPNWALDAEEVLGKLSL
jgi:UDP-N-acetylglucosamine/UDP-N-acetylgalactosamine diphosphorylase